MMLPNEIYLNITDFLQEDEDLTSFNEVCQTFEALTHATLQQRKKVCIDKKIQDTLRDFINTKFNISQEEMDRTVEFLIAHGDKQQVYCMLKEALQKNYMMSMDLQVDNENFRYAKITYDDLTHFSFADKYSHPGMNEDEVLHADRYYMLRQTLGKFFGLADYFQDYF